MIIKNENTNYNYFSPCKCPLRKPADSLALYFSIWFIKKNVRNISTLWLLIISLFFWTSFDLLRIIFVTENDIKPKSNTCCLTESRLVVLQTRIAIAPDKPAKRDNVSTPSWSPARYGSLEELKIHLACPEAKDRQWRPSAKTTSSERTAQHSQLL